MPQYIYTAIDSNGKQFEATIEAASTSQVIQRLREKEQYLLSIVDKEEVYQSKEIGTAKKISTKSLSVFCRQFATLINAGTTAVKSLDILHQQSEDKLLKASLGRVYENVQKGEAMSEAFRRQGTAYPELFINMLFAGESSGNLDSVLIRLADHYERENKLNNKIKGATVYPTVLSLLTVVIVIFLVVFIVPTFTDFIVASGDEIPLPTRILLGMSDFIRSYWWLLLSVIILAVISWRAFTRSEKGRLWWDTKKLSMPIVSKSLKMIYTARFARTLSSLLSSGIQMLPAIEITSRVIGNQLVSNQLVESIEDIRKGITLSAAVKKIEHFPPMIYNMISVGEESGMLDDILDKTAGFFDEESEAAIQRLVGLIEPLLIIFMGLVIGMIVVAIYLPMIGMSAAAG